MSDRLDIIIFGATGYTGQFTVQKALTVIPCDVRWGIAGRNKEKLQKTIDDVTAKTGQDLSKIPIIIADVSDYQTLVEMAKQARVIVNVCGPYKFHGESVVRACLEGGASHVDISGEMYYMEEMQLKYHEEAKAKGVYIVSACGFDSIPHDIGLNFLEREFNGTVNDVETYVRSYFVDNYKPNGAQFNFGTYESTVHELAGESELKKLRTKLFPEKLPAFNPELKERFVMHRSPVLEENRWSLPFMGTDRDVVYRSQRYMFEAENKRPVQLKAYISLPSLFAAFKMIFAIATIAIFSKFSCTRNLLVRHPKFFTFGFASREGPSVETNEHNKFDIVFAGKGWKEKSDDPMHKFDGPMNKKIITKVSAMNQAYGATCTSLLTCGLMILKESDKMPSTGGVLPPGAAFRNTSMIEKLQKHGFTFEVLKVEE